MRFLFKNSHLLVTILIFLACFEIGLSLAQRRPLWNDEIYTQTQSIQKLSYTDILLGHSPEGMNCPLFYIIQKVVSDATQLHLPTINQKEYTTIERSARIILRLSANTAMSLAIAILFFYFSKNFSWLSGFFALGSALSSFMVWAYWAEARPYALWLALTTIQLLILINAISKNQLKEQRPFLFLVHLLLSLTSVFSLWQIAIASLLFWKSDTQKRRPILLGLLSPIIICLYYYWTAFKFDILFPPLPKLVEIILFTFPLEQMIILAISATFLMITASTRNTLRWKIFNTMSFKTHIFFTLGIFLSTAITLLAIKLKNLGVTHGGYFNFRHLIYLTPFGIIVQSLFFCELANASRGKFYIMANLLTVAWTIVILRFLDTYMSVVGWYPTL